MPTTHPPEAPRSSNALLTAPELAARWRVRTSHIYNLTRSGALPVVKIGRYRRYSLRAVESLEAQGGVELDAA